MTTKPQPAAELSASEMFESLTGHDEYLIERHFTKGDTVTAWAQERPLWLGRAMVMIHQIRTRGIDAVAAKTAALDLTMGQVNAYFLPEEDPELDGDDPETESGKDDSLDA